MLILPFSLASFSIFISSLLSVGQGEAVVKVSYSLYSAFRTSALCAAKQAMLQGLNMPLDEGLKLEQRLFRGLFGTEDAVEGPWAFAERRKPHFKAR